MHIAIRQADKSAGDTASSPKNRIGIRATRVGHGLVLKWNVLRFSHRFNTRYHLRMIASAMRDSWSPPKFNIAMLSFVDGWVIGCVSHIDDQSNVGFE